MAETGSAKHDNGVEHHATALALGSDIGARVINKTTERQYVWKLDLTLLPLLAIIYFTHSLDRANLGNAKTANFEKDVGLRDNQYSLILVLFYIPYGTLNIPLTVLARRFNPAVVIPVLMFCWGLIAAASASVTNFGGILAARICLGVVEAGFFPSAIFYLTLFYTPAEIAKRISLFYMMGFVANAFSGLIAWSVFQWHKPLHNWQYLFIIEGCMTCALAIVAFFLLPRTVESSRYFSASEKAVARHRAGPSAQLESEDFSWRSTLLPLKEPQTWLYGAMALSYGVACASVSNFLPTMIKRLATDTVKTNLYTIAPNLSGAVFIIMMCTLSDYFQQRALFIILGTVVSMIGFILLGSLDLTRLVGVGYFCTFLITFGTFTSAVLVPAWASGNTVSRSGRATTLGLIAGLQNLGGIISSVAFRSEDAPVYRPALITSGVFQACVVLLAGAGWAWYRQENRKAGQSGNAARYVL
ncbi:Uu.00g058870.m01.CDS01 [Anthostomella pinea]|uniref:Uu.00g058870.m01.CDS01 n=1 Tax=Anthostomella pinea TaxID=933095 RepID=A0AAI8VT53_9PEZI|nr:Uu.00g058870.m01.CDS01 [Anthostomella pinea]